MQTIEMPKTYRERLESLEKGGSILIDQQTRGVWSNNVSRLHSENEEVLYSIRTDRINKEIRVWRIK